MPHRFFAKGPDLASGPLVYLHFQGNASVPNTAAIVVAGGKGVRFGSQVPKQFLTLAGQSIIHRSLDLFERVPEVSSAYVVLPEEHLDSLGEHVDLDALPKFRRAVRGGVLRQDSVFAGLQAVEDEAELVAVHDAVRPLADPSLISQAIALAAEVGGAILASPSTDTLKRCDEEDRISGTVDRDSIWRAQTPQVFDFKVLFEIYEKVIAEGIEITDEAQAFERAGRPVAIVESPPSNHK